MNEASTKTASQDDDAEGVHRLRDIVVDEVSLVDRAANQRRFLVVKRSPDMADESTASADGSGVEKAKKKPAGAEAVDEEKARKKPADDEEKDASDTEKARGAAKDDDEEEEDAEGEPTKKARKQELVLAAPVKEALLRVLTEALERLMALANAIKEADGARGRRQWPPCRRTSRASSPRSPTCSTNVGKRKRTKRMSRRRGHAWRRTGSTASRRRYGAARRHPEGAHRLEGGTGAPAHRGRRRDRREEARHRGARRAIPDSRSSVTGIGELTRVVKRQEEELARIRQARGVSNAIPVESARRAEPQEVSWPLDMNRPISRDKVKKEVSFFDE
jgi:hypothetical protein